MDIQNPQTGPRTVQDGSQSRLRTERTGGLVVQPAHGEYYEDSSRGNTWTISTALAGVTTTANFAVSLASSRCVVGIFNPTAGVNLHITRTVIEVVTGALATGGFVWGTINSPTGITSVGVQGRNNKTFAKGGHLAYAFDGSLDVTGSSTTALFRYIGGGVAGSGGAGSLSTFEETESDMVVGPGAFAGVFLANAVAAGIVVGSLSWTEIPA